MAEINAKIQLELVDGPALKALNEFTQKSGAADKAVGGLNKSLGGLSKGVDANSVSFSGFAKIISDDFGGKGSQAVGQFASLLSGPLLLALGAVASAGLVVKKVLDLTFLAERNEQIANSFNAIAASAGLAGDKLAEGLVAATRGLADDDDVLRAANKSIIELGDNAERIPEIMDIARKASALFGGELVSRFEELSQALASGNTRALRNIGLIIDADKAQRDYAASIGFTVAQLSDSAKKQAIINAALAQAKDKFKDVDESSNTATQAFQRLKVSSGQLIDNFAKAISQSSILSSVFNGLAKTLDDFSPPKTILEEYTREIARQQVNVETLTRAIEERTRAANEADNSMFKNGDSIRADIKNMEAQRKAVLSVIDGKKAYISALEEEDRKRGNGTNAKKVLEADLINQEALRKQRSDSAKAQADAEVAIAQASADLELQILRDKLFKRQITQEEFNTASYAVEQESFAARQAIEAQRFIDENAALELKFRGALNAESGYFAQRDALATQFAAKGVKLDADELRRKNQLEQDKQALRQKEFKQASDFAGGFATLMQTQNRELFALGKAAALAQATINGYNAITLAYAQTGFFGGPLAAAAVAVATGVQIANIASTNPSFASGGIVPGTSYTGDKVTANVNSGEMVLNKSQQSNLFSQIKSGGGSGDISELKELLAHIARKDENIIVNIGGKTVVDTLRSELAGGRRFE